MRSRVQATAAHCSAISLIRIRRWAFLALIVCRHAFCITIAARTRFVGDRRREQRKVRAPITTSRSNMREAEVVPATRDANLDEHV